MNEINSPLTNYKLFSLKQLMFVFILFGINAIGMKLKM
jgi:hypothetical protein